MNFIERAVKALEQAHEAEQHGNPQAVHKPLVRVRDNSTPNTAVNDLEIGDTGPFVAVAADKATTLVAASQTLTSLGQTAAAAEPSRAFDKPDAARTKTTGRKTNDKRSVPVDADQTGSATTSDPDDDKLNNPFADENLDRDNVDTYTGAVYRNSADRVRAAHVRALRAKIDEVEKSVNEAPVSLPAAPVRAARASRSAADTGNSTHGETTRKPLLDAVGLPITVTDNSQDSALWTIPPEPGEMLDTAFAANPVSEMPPKRDNVSEPATDNLSDTSFVATIDADNAVEGSDAMTSVGGRLKLKTIRAAAYLDPNGREDKLREAFQPIADDLLEQVVAGGTAPNALNRRVMLTSVDAGAGRSLCAMHLALSLVVDHGQQVTYIDLDFQGTSIIPELGVKPGRGVADWLDGQVQTLDALIVPTELRRLRLIGSGSSGALSRQSSKPDRQSLSAFLLALNSRYPQDLIIIDAPPVLAGDQAEMLAGLAGQVVVVVAADSTPRRRLQQALGALDRHSRVSVMLNKVR